MNADDLDRVAYRAWWEAEGREDLGTCPCDNPVTEAWATGRALPSGGGFCARHYGYRLTNVSREELAGWIINGTFGERDATEDELRKAQRVADGKTYRWDA